MSSVGCPRCEESFRIPDAPLPIGIRLRCPWCSETFQLTELASRLLPMVDLIGEDDQPIELATLMAMPHQVGAAAANPASWQPSQFVAQGNDTEASAFESDATIAIERTIVMDRVDDLELSAADPHTDSGKTVEVLPNGGETFEEMDGDVENISMTTEAVDFDPTGFASDQFEPTEAQDYEYRDSDSDLDAYQAVVDQGERLPVTGPVAPRPLGSSVPREYEQGPVATRSRSKKKQGSGIGKVVGVVMGAALSVPLAAVILSLAGKPLDLGFWPFDGTSFTSTTVAGFPRDLSADRPKPSGAPGRSLTEDLKPRSDNPGVAEPLADTSSENPAMAIELPSNEVTAELPPTVAIESASPALTLPAEPMPTELSPIETVPSTPEPVATAAEIAQPAEPSFNDMVENGINSDAKPIVEPTPAPTISFDTPPSPKLVEAIKAAEVALQALVDVTDTIDPKVRSRRVADLYAAIANVAMFPQTVSQAETAAFFEHLTSSGLATDMINAAPVWLRTDKRTNQGFIGSGKVARENNAWMLNWNGPADLMLQDVNGLKFSDGDEVLLLGKIVDATPPSIIRVVFMKKQ